MPPPDKIDDKTKLASSFSTNYKVGSLWQARTNVMCMNLRGKWKWIPYKSFVLVIDYKKNEVEESIFVLYNNDVYFINNVDVGHSFNMTPKTKQTRPKVEELHCIETLNKIK